MEAIWARTAVAAATSRSAGRRDGLHTLQEIRVVCGDACKLAITFQ
jgi:hypothetical protein